MTEETRSPAEMPVSAAGAGDAGSGATATPSPVVAVVLVHETMRHVLGCVTALLASEGVASQVLVVDNGSSAEARATLASAITAARLTALDGATRVRVLETGRNLGYAGGNNVGIAAALEGGASYVLVINDDTAVAPEALARLVAALEAEPSAAAASPTMVHAGAPERIWWAGGVVDRRRALGTHERSPAARQGPPRDVGSLCGCAILFRAAALRAVGPFDATYFMYGEDVEWSVRAARAGWRLLHVPEARLAHAVPFPEPPPAAWKIRLRDRNRRRLVRQHFRGPERWRFALWFYPTRVVWLVRYLLVGDRARARAVAQGMHEP